MGEPGVSDLILGELAFFLSLVACSEGTRHVVRWQFPGHQTAVALEICSLTLGWYSTSITLVLLNKWVLSSWMGGGLDFPIFYTMTHMVLKGLFSLLYILVFRCRSAELPSWKTLKMASMIGVLVGLDVVASNISFQYITVTFYVMVKSSALLWILMFGMLANVEPCSPQIIAAVIVTASGMFLSTYGEADFNLTGFCLVLASEIFAAARWVSTQALMRDTDLDAVTAVLYMFPGSTLSLLPLVFVREFDEVTRLISDGSQMLSYITLAVVPGFLAFGLIVLEVRLVQETSSLTLAVLGNLKSVATIMFAILIFRESATLPQWCGVTIGTVGMIWYSYFKELQNSVTIKSAGGTGAKYEIIPATQTKILSCPFSA